MVDYTGGYGGGGFVPMQNNADVQWYNAMASAANQAAQQTYNQAVLAGQSDDRALAAAKFAWQKKLDEATQTGKWNGQWNNPQEQWFTGQFGTWFGEGGAPQTGQQTLAAQQQGFTQAYNLAGQYGSYFAPGTTPTAGTATQDALKQAANISQGNAALTGYLQGGGGTGNIAMDAFNTKASQADQQTYLNAKGGDRGAAAAQYYQDVQGAVRDAVVKAGGQFSPQSMNDFVYGQGQQTLAGNEQQFTQGLRTEQEARAAQAQQQSQTMGYLNLLSNLRGPADWAKYQQVLGSTPGGMRDLVAAAAGQYVPGGGATTGYQPQAVSLQSMVGDVSGNPYYGQGGGQLNQPNVYGQNTTGMYAQQQGYGGDPNALRQQQAQQYAGGQPGQAQWYGGGQGGQMYDTRWTGGGQQAQGNEQVWGSGIGVGQQQTTPAQQQQGLGGGTNLPAPNQINAQGWKNMAPSQQQMLLGMYENQGWDKNDVTALFNQSLPKYASNAPTAGTWRMQ